MNTDNTAKRTPGPWEICGYHTPDHVANVFPETDGATFLISIRKTRGKLIAKATGYLNKEEAEANAAFIVRACNNFDALLATAKEMFELVRWDHHEGVGHASPDQETRFGTAIANAEK